MQGGERDLRSFGSGGEARTRVHAIVSLDPGYERVEGSISFIYCSNPVTAFVASYTADEINIVSSFLA